jgi:Fe2+ or Zn2+ uptake regulation protein
MRRSSEQQLLERGSGGSAPADHLRCMGCDVIVEYRSPVLDAFRRALSEKFGFELTSRRFEGHGLCRACQSKRTSSRR